jgi:hypothetical protein
MRSAAPARSIGSPRITQSLPSRPLPNALANEAVPNTLGGSGQPVASPRRLRLSMRAITFAAAIAFALAWMLIGRGT